MPDMHYGKYCWVSFILLYLTIIQKCCLAEDTIYKAYAKCYSLLSFGNKSNTVECWICNFAMLCPVPPDFDRQLTHYGGHVTESDGSEPLAAWVRWRKSTFSFRDGYSTRSQIASFIPQQCHCSSLSKIWKSLLLKEWPVSCLQ